MKSIEQPKTFDLRKKMSSLRKKVRTQIRRNTATM
jgi:hypothetical protein